MSIITLWGSRVRFPVARAEAVRVGLPNWLSSLQVRALPLPALAPSLQSRTVLEQEELARALSEGWGTVCAGPATIRDLDCLWRATCMWQQWLPRPSSDAASGLSYLSASRLRSFLGHGSSHSSVELWWEASKAGMFTWIRLVYTLGKSWETSQPPAWFQCALSSLLQEQASTSTLLLSWAQASHSPPVSPASPPGGSSSFCRTPGLGHPICGLNHSLPRESLHPWNLPSPLSAVPRAQVPSCRCIFDVFVGGGEFHVLLLLYLDLRVTGFGFWLFVIASSPFFCFVTIDLDKRTFKLARCSSLLYSWYYLALSTWTILLGILLLPFPLQIEEYVSF